MNDNPPLPVLPYGRQWLEDDDVAAVVDCLRGDWLTQGPLVGRFEEALCQVTGAHHAVAVSSGTAALHLAALVAGVGPGDTGITSAITFVASANCIAYCGGVPHFADVDAATGLISLESLASRVDELSRTGQRPKLLVPVDLAGQPAPLPGVQEIAGRCGAMVVEDAAHALGATYQHGGTTYRAGSCSHTDQAILSFHPVKQVTTGEGGAVLTNDRKLAGRLRELRTHGIHKDSARLERTTEGPWYYEQAELGFHYRITDIQCALGLSQVAKLERFVTRRRVLAAQYDRALSAKPLAAWLAPLRQVPGSANAYHLYVVRVTSPGASAAETAALRRDLYQHLAGRRILTQVHYIPVPWQPYYRRSDAVRGRAFPGADAYYASCLSLPLFPKMSDVDADRVIAALGEWCARRSRG